MKIKLTIFVAILVLFALTGCFFSGGSYNETIPIPDTTEPIKTTIDLNM